MLPADKKAAIMQATFLQDAHIRDSESNYWADHKEIYWGL